MVLFTFNVEPMWCCAKEDVKQKHVDNNSHNVCEFEKKIEFEFSAGIHTLTDSNNPPPPNWCWVYSCKLSYWEIQQNVNHWFCFILSIIENIVFLS